MLRYLVLQDLKYCIRPGFVWQVWYLPGRTKTEQRYKFPVSANDGVLLHIETRCHVSVLCIAQEEK